MKLFSFTLRSSSLLQPASSPLITHPPHTSLFCHAPSSAIFDWPRQVDGQALGQAWVKACNRLNHQEMNNVNNQKPEKVAPTRGGLLPTLHPGSYPHVGLHITNLCADAKALYDGPDKSKSKVAQRLSFRQCTRKSVCHVRVAC